MGNRNLRNVIKKDWTRNINRKSDSFNFLWFSVSKRMSFKDLMGLVLLLSFGVSFLWNFIFFYRIHTVPTSTDANALWFYVGTVILGIYLITLLCYMVLLPSYIISKIKLEKIKFWSTAGIVLLRVAPYCAIFFLSLPVSVIKIVIMFVFYSFVVLVVFALNKKLIRYTKTIILFLILSFVFNMTVLFVFDVSVIKERRSFLYVFIFAVILLVIQWIYELLRRKNKNFFAATAFAIVLLLTIFVYYMPNVIDGYRFHEMMLIAPYNKFNVGYYYADIVVNKSSYNMIQSLHGNPESDTPEKNDYTIKNAFILFSLGDEYIIQTCVDKVMENENNSEASKRAKYRYHIVKASRNSEILPSSYTYEKYEWASLHNDNELCHKDTNASSHEFTK